MSANTPLLFLRSGPLGNLQLAQLAVVFLKITAILLLVPCSPKFSQLSRLSVYGNSVYSYKICGYDSQPIISLTNGTVLVWDKQKIETGYPATIQCYVGPKKQVYGSYVGLVFNGKMMLFKNKIDYLEAVEWNPFLTQPHIQIRSMKIGPNIIAIHSFDTLSSSPNISIYRSRTLIQLELSIWRFTNITSMEIDHYDNLLLIVVDIIEESRLYACTGYDLKYSCWFNRSLGYDQRTLQSMVNQQVFPSGTFFTGLILYYRNKLDYSLSIRNMTIYYERFNSYQKTYGVSFVLLSDQQRWFGTRRYISCNGQYFIYDPDDHCFRLDQSCDFAQVEYGTCAREDSHLISALDRHKVVGLHFNQEQKGYEVVLYEQTRILPIFVISLISFVIGANVLIIIAFILYKYGVPITKLLPCKCCRKQEPDTEQHSQKIITSNTQ